MDVANAAEDITFPHVITSFYQRTALIHSNGSCLPLRYVLIRGQPKKCSTAAERLFHGWRRGVIAA